MNEENKKLRDAVLAGDLDAVKQCLDAGTDPNVIVVEPPLITAADKGYTHIVTILLDRGADVNGQDVFGFTALHLASGRGYTDIVTILLDRGAAVNGQNIFGFTPLYMAVPYTDIATALLEHDADLNVTDKDGRTPLHLAALLLDADIFTLLLNAAAKPDVQNQDGETPVQIIVNLAHEGDKKAQALVDGLKTTHPEVLMDWWTGDINH